MKLKDYVAYWKDSSKRDLYYLKDWHMTKVISVYKTPSFFGSDWLNEYWDELKTDDYKFVYLGPKGSWTPFHTDVFGSYSWSANVGGYKKWIFFPRSTEPQNVYDIFEKVPKSDHFDFKLKHHENFSYFEVIQGPGEVIFVPSGWFHQVENLTDTLSINHNWCNGTNILIIWENLMLELAKVKAEMSDCFIQNDQEWRKMCQKLLFDSYGMNYSTFLDLLTLITQKRLKNRASFDNWTYGANHIVYDLSEAQRVIEKVIHSSCDDLLPEDLKKAEALLLKK